MRSESKRTYPHAPFFLSYILSFVYVAIYWNNHHHIHYLVGSINGSALGERVFAFMAVVHSFRH